VSYQTRGRVQKEKGKLQGTLTQIQPTLPKESEGRKQEKGTK